MGDLSVSLVGLPKYVRRMALAGSVAALSSLSPLAGAAPIYAGSATTQDVTFFGSGILTGAPDSGGAFLSNTFDPPTLAGSIIAGFAGGLVNGAGVDLVIYDCCGGGGVPLTNEFADVFVSTDGVAFTLVGAYGGAGQINSYDFDGVFAGVVHFVKIVNTGTVNSPDIDAFQGNFAASIPEPGTLALLGLALAGFAASRRRKQ